MATAPQQKKFDQFLSLPESAAYVELLKRAIHAAELTSETCGVNWGVTVCPDKDTILRINRGNIALLDLCKGLFEPSDPKLFIRAAVIDSKLGFTTPRGIDLYPGFTNRNKESLFAIGTWDKWGTKFFDEKKIARAFKAHSEDSERNLPNPNWHNPLVNSLLS
jgi:hypothetical protein